MLEIDCRWSESDCALALPTLPEQVQMRAARYLSPLSRRNLIATRARLKAVVESLGLDQELLDVAENGRPYYRDQSIEFNLTHSHDRAVLAISREKAWREGLGVDLEWTERSVDVVAVGRRFFTPEEHAWVGTDRQRFFHIWTRKEAVLKSNGIGLRVALDSFDVLSDRVAEHVTGRPLHVATKTLSDGYLLSWATSTLPPRIIALQDHDEQWLVSLKTEL